MIAQIGKIHEEFYLTGAVFTPNQGTALRLERPEKELNEELVNDTLTKCEKFYQGIFEKDTENKLEQNLGGKNENCLF